MGKLEQIQGAVHTALQGDWPRLAIVVAGHNGSGKTTLWYSCLANELQLPLLNADRLLLSFLPDAGLGKRCRNGRNALGIAIPYGCGPASVLSIQ